MKNLSTFAVSATIFVWLVSMVLSYESQVEFAIAIGMTSTIFGVPKAYAFPILTDLVICVSAAWSLLAVMNNLPSWPYRLASLVFGLVTIWFNANHIDITQASYTKLFAVAWVPFMVIVTTEMLLHHFSHIPKPENTLESRVSQLETISQLTPYLALPVANETEIGESDDNRVSSLQKAQQARQAKYKANLDKALGLFNEGKGLETVAAILDVSTETARKYKNQLNGQVKYGQGV